MRIHIAHGWLGRLRRCPTSYAGALRGSPVVGSTNDQYINKAAVEPPLGSLSPTPRWGLGDFATKFVFFVAATITLSSSADANSVLDRLLASYDRNSLHHRISVLEQKTARLKIEVDHHAKIISTLVWPALPTKEDK